MKIGALPVEPALGVAPMAGMTDTAFRRLVKRHGGCGLVVSEMVSSEGLVRGIDRTLEYAEYTEEERPVSIQIFGGDPAKMADAAAIVEGMGASAVDVNMGCPVPKISKHNAGCSLMRDPSHAAAIIGAMTRAVKIPVTVKMRAGWTDDEINAPLVARLVADAGASAVTVHGRTAKQAYTGVSDWSLIDRVAGALAIPVIGSGDLVEPEQIVERLRTTRVAGVIAGRGVLRNPWLLAQASDLLEGRPARLVSNDGARPLPPRLHRPAAARARRRGDRLPPHGADGAREAERAHREPAQGRERWVINKLRALMSWYSKGLDGGSHLRIRVNAATSIGELRDIVHEFFVDGVIVLARERTPTLV